MDDEDLKITETNYVATGYVKLPEGQFLELHKWALHNFGMIYTHYKFSSGRRNTVYPRVSSSMYKGGRLSIMAADSPEATRLAMVKALASLRRMGMPGARLTSGGISINNIACSAHIVEGIDLKRLKEAYPAAVTYVKKKFNGARLDTAILGIPNTKIVLQIYASGKINVVGAKTLEESKRVFEIVRRQVLDKMKPTTQQAVQLPNAEDDNDGENLDDAIFQLKNTISGK
jgi:TATA-box binding protein (TBP) (component of TFIID and TFIIIB)